jgi:hypothetical protein
MACDRFEREGLAQREEGAALDPHFSTCPDCRRAQAVYERLGQVLAGSGSLHQPPAGWQERVWKAIEREPPRRRPWGWVLVPSVLAAALALVAVLWPRPSPVALEASLETPRDAVRRGQDTPPGTRLTLRASDGGAPYAELRVYFNESRLFLRCSREAPCRREGDRLLATTVLDGVGSYQPVLLVSSRPLPEPSSTLDRDAAAALAGGAGVTLGDEIRVR